MLLSENRDAQGAVIFLGHCLVHRNGNVVAGLSVIVQMEHCICPSY